MRCIRLNAVEEKGRILPNLTDIFDHPRGLNFLYDALPVTVIPGESSLSA